ncbi:hypothetical protein LCGC14_0101950 [marine sediment metagenome]|uniref:ParB/Sulfiredoxin domain-containing protein n=1 Tax=marine sediment metagenome TaxID=412755 RepID=A0A0F9VC43_9ZZZZ|nr:hypothetical protein [Candidatus Nealsonbacteria bacterium]
MDAKKQWRDKKVSISELSLDLQNPRVPKHVKELKDVNQVRNYLLEKEGVMMIARSIANNGYHRSAVAIICEENGESIVLDGNRRLAACQLLLNPKLAPGARNKKELEGLGKILNKRQLKSVKITIAPSRKEAEKEIWDIHVNQLLKPWQVLQRLRMYRNLIDGGEYTVDSASKEYGTTTAKFKDELGKLYFYEYILDQVEGAKKEEELLKTGFNTIERLIISANGKKLIDYLIDDKGNIIFKNRKNAESNLKKLLPYIVGEKKIPAQATKDYLLDNVFSKIDPIKFPKTKLRKKKKSKRRSPNIPSLKLRRRRNSVKYPLQEAVEIVDHVLIHFDAVAEQLKDRYKNRETLNMGDEYDVQDLLHALLTMFFDDVENEVWNPSDGASPSRGDFLLLDNGTIIEVKTTLKRKGGDKSIRKNIEKELNDDLVKYSRRPDCKRIYFFIYDPEKKIKKHSTLERAFTHDRLKNIKVSLIINRG